MSNLRLFKLPSNKLFINKYDRAHERLDTLLTKYLNEMYDAYNKNLLSTGYDIAKRHINVGPIEYNNYKYSSNDATYQFY